MRGYWNRIKAGWYHRGLRHSTLPDAALSIILPRAGDVRTFLDVGAGCGALSVPLARAGKRVTALDPSQAMLELLDEDIRKEGLRDIRTLIGAWGEAPVKPHDAVICANVPELLKDPAPFLRDADRLARKMVVIIEKADPASDKFYYKELYPLLFNRPFAERSDYLKTYAALHAMGIFANVEIIEYDFDQPFDSLDEAMEFWKEYLGIVTEEHDCALRGFLAKKLVRVKGGLMARFHKKAAVIWWRKDARRPAKGKAPRPGD
jgi:SAM-dependent methyltransferase